RCPTVWALPSRRTSRASSSVIPGCLPGSSACMAAGRASMNPDNRIKLRHLHCFLEVARQGSVQRAADALAISQPAVSKTLRELEELLCNRLFERNRQGVVLTEAGTAFLHVAGPSLQALRRGIENLRSDEFKAGELRLGVLSSVETWLMPEIISRLHLHPQGTGAAQGHRQSAQRRFQGRGAACGGAVLGGDLADARDHQSSAPASPGLAHQRAERPRCLPAGAAAQRRGRPGGGAPERQSP